MESGQDQRYYLKKGKLGNFEGDLLDFLKGVQKSNSITLPV